jgi:hypothetical protein
MPMVGGFGRLRGKPGLLRKFLLVLGWSALIGVGAGTIVWALDIGTRSAYHIMVGDVFSLATLVIAFLAAAVALFTYQVSTGLPDLRLGIMFYGEKEPYSHVMDYKTNAKRWAELGNWFSAENDYSNVELEEDPGGWTKIAYIWIDNESKYSAHNPTVIVRFGWNDKSTVGLCKSWKSKDDLPWKDTAFTSSGIVVLATQWDGGSEYPIHGLSTRRLPNLPLVTLFSTDAEAKFDIELLADGYRKVETITMNFTVEPAQAEEQQAVHQKENRERCRVLFVLKRRHSAKRHNNHS